MWARSGNDAKVEDITQGLAAVVQICGKKAPDATIIITGIFPRNDNMAVIPTINKVNENLAKMADGKKIRFLNVNDKLADKDGKLFDGMMNNRDKLHPTVKGYQVWADGRNRFCELLRSAATDHAPAPTGDRRIPRLQPDTDLNNALDPGQTFGGRFCLSCSIRVDPIFVRAIHAAGTDFHQR